MSDERAPTTEPTVSSLASAAGRSPSEPAAAVPPTDGSLRSGVAGVSGGRGAPSEGQRDDRSARWLRRVGASLGLVGMLAGTLFAITTLRSRPGASSPDGAVRALLAAVADGDAVGVADALVPAERGLLLDDAVPVFEDLRRLGALGASASLRNLGADGYRGTLQGLHLRARRTSERRAEVDILGGTLTTSVDVARLPFGTSLRDRDGGVLGRTGSRRRTIDLARSADGRRVVVERVSGRWGVSIARTTLQRWAATAVPEGAVAPAGAATPEDAVRVWFDAIRRLDAERFLSVLAPGEVGVVQEAASRFLPGVQQQLATLDGQYRFELPGLSLDPSTSGDRSVVRVRSLDVDFELAQPDSPVLRIETASGCVRVELGDQVHRRCGATVPRLLDDLGVPVSGDGLDALVPPAPSPGWAIVAVRERGRWYVSPGRTLLHDLHRRLTALDPEEFKRQADALAKAFAGRTFDWSAGIFAEI